MVEGGPARRFLEVMQPADDLFHAIQHHRVACSASLEAAKENGVLRVRYKLLKVMHDASTS